MRTSSVLTPCPYRSDKIAGGPWGLGGPSSPLPCFLLHVSVYVQSLEACVDYTCSLPLGRLVVLGDRVVPPPILVLRPSGGGLLVVPWGARAIGAVLPTASIVIDRTRVGGLWPAAGRVKINANYWPDMFRALPSTHNSCRRRRPLMTVWSSAPCRSGPVSGENAPRTNMR